MWEFLGIIIEQLSETFRGFLIGYFGTISLLILLYKNNLLTNKPPLGFLKKISYYLFLPIYIAIVSWFLSATLIVEKDAKDMASYTLTKAEDSTLTLFFKEAVSYSSEWVDGKIGTKEELVAYYLEKNGYTQGDYSTQIVEWTLNNGLEYVKKQAIEQGTIQIGNESINFPLLIQEYLNNSNALLSTPFTYLKGMTFRVIHSYCSKLYWIYGILFFVVALIIGLDILFTTRRKKNLPSNTSTVLNNTQDKLTDNQKRIQ